MSCQDELQQHREPLGSVVATGLGWSRQGLALSAAARLSPCGTGETAASFPRVAHRIFTISATRRSCARIVDDDSPDLGGRRPEMSSRSPSAPPACRRTEHPWCQEANYTLVIPRRKLVARMGIGLDISANSAHSTRPDGTRSRRNDSRDPQLSSVRFRAGSSSPVRHDSKSCSGGRNG
jgi:hypothetical protein